MWWIFYRESVYLCTCVNVYKYVGIISYGSWCLSFTVCKRMLIFLGKVLWEQSGKVDSHKQANLRHLLRETLESLFTVLQISTAHHNLCFSSFFYYYYSAASGRICCVFSGCYYGWVWGLSKGRGAAQLNWDSQYPSGPCESLWRRHHRRRLPEKASHPVSRHPAR